MTHTRSASRVHRSLAAPTSYVRTPGTFGHHSASSCDEVYVRARQGLPFLEPLIGRRASSRGRGALVHPMPDVTPGARAEHMAGPRVGGERFSHARRQLVPGGAQAWAGGGPCCDRTLGPVKAFPSGPRRTVPRARPGPREAFASVPRRWSKVSKVGAGPITQLPVIAASFLAGKLRGQANKGGSAIMDMDASIPYSSHMVTREERLPPNSHCTYLCCLC
jgi:hypothetical protein